MSNSEIATSTIGIINHSVSFCKWKSCAFSRNDIARTTFFFYCLLSFCFFWIFFLFFFLSLLPLVFVFVFSQRVSTHPPVYLLLWIAFSFDSFAIITWFLFFFNVYRRIYLRRPIIIRCWFFALPFLRSVVRFIYHSPSMYDDIMRSGNARILFGSWCVFVSLSHSVCICVCVQCKKASAS